MRKGTKRRPRGDGRPSGKTPNNHVKGNGLNAGVKIAIIASSVVAVLTFLIFLSAMLLPSSGTKVAWAMEVLPYDNNSFWCVGEVINNSDHPVEVWLGGVAPNRQGNVRVAGAPSSINDHHQRDNRFSTSRRKGYYLLDCRFLPYCRADRGHSRCLLKEAGELKGHRRQSRHRRSLNRQG